jgi:hypothetical protein
LWLVACGHSYHTALDMRSFWVCVWGGGLVGGGGVAGLWFENCIVDASIFCNTAKFLFVVFVVCLLVKFFRAYGGCLGTRSR